MFKIFSRSNTSFLFGIAAFILMALTSCEKEVKINLDAGDPRLVVEGSIESGLPPFVILTKSIGYFATIDLQTLQNSFVHGAIVKVSDGNRTITLREYNADTSFGNKFSFYTIDTADNFFVGEIEKTYKLTIEHEGKTYESYTKIPTPTPLDSVVTAIPPFTPRENPNAKHLRIYFKDPDSLGNCVRYFTKRNSETYYPGFNSVYNDELINGTHFETTLPAGEDRSSGVGFDSLGYFHPGDTVTLKWCAIDKSVYNYWNTFEYALGTLGSPFASPIKVKTNISNNGLGIWAGYGTIYTTLIIK